MSIHINETDTLIRETVVAEEPGMTQEVADSEADKEKLAHFISPHMNIELWNAWGLSDPGGAEGVRMLVQMAAKAGEELVALCEYRWVPTGAPASQDACEACLTIAGNWISEDES